MSTGGKGLTAPEISHDPESRNQFDVLGLPSKLSLDTKNLSAHFYALSRLHHPDFHQNAAAAERLKTLRHAAAVNDAYETLRDPVKRGRWWLEFRGRKAAMTPRVPPALGFLVFEVQDALEEMRGGAAGTGPVLRFREAVNNELTFRGEQLDQLFRDLDEVAPGEDNALLEQLEELLAEMSYLRTLLRDIEQGLESAGEQ